MLNSNVLMCVEVGIRLPHPRQHAYLRCAGTTGYNTFEELVASEKHVASYIEVSTSHYSANNKKRQLLLSFSTSSVLPPDLHVDSTPTIMHVPFTDINTGYLKTTHRSYLPDSCIMVYNHKVGRATYRETPWQPVFQFDVRYEWDVDLHTIPSAFPMTFAGLRDTVGGRVEITQTQAIRYIAPLFMHRCLNVQSIILHDLQNLTTIQPEFMMECRSLKTIELSEMSQLQSIGASFMTNCSSLKSINLASISRINTIGTHFMSGCTALENIELPTTLKNLTYLGGHFMFNCASLKTIMLRDVAKLPCIYWFFLQGCVRLQSITMTSLGAVEAIHGSFMKNCSSLVELELVGLTSLKLIKPRFMEGCGQLARLTLSVALTSEKDAANAEEYSETTEENSAGTVSGGTTVQDTSTEVAQVVHAEDCDKTSSGPFEVRADHPQYITSPPTHHLSTLPDFFLRGCSSLHTAAISPSLLAEVHTIGQNVFEGCRMLDPTSMLTQMTNVSGVGPSFMWGCLMRPSINTSSFTASIKDAINEEEIAPPTRSRCVLL